MSDAEANDGGMRDGWRMTNSPRIVGVYYSNRTTRLMALLLSWKYFGLRNDVSVAVVTTRTVALIQAAVISIAGYV